MCNTILFSDSMKNKITEVKCSEERVIDDTIISSHPYIVEDDVIVVARPREDTSDLPQNLYRLRSSKT